VLEVENPEEACLDEDLATAVKLAKAELAGSDPESVDLSCNVQEGARRLDGNSRRLAGSIEFVYRIEVASAEAASSLADKISSEDPDAFASLIEKHLPEGSSYDIKVLSMSATAVVVTITTTATTTEGEELSDSLAPAPAVLRPVAMAVIAVSMVFSQ